MLLQHYGKKVIAVALVELSVFLAGIQARASHRLLVFSRNTLNFKCRYTWGRKYSVPRLHAVAVKEEEEHLPFEEYNPK